MLSLHILLPNLRMTRIFAIILCLFSALYLVPVQGECIAVPEYESDTELDYTHFRNTPFVVTAAVAATVGRPRCQRVALMPYTPAVSDVRPLLRMPPFRLPVRIMHCVFRE